MGMSTNQLLWQRAYLLSLHEWNKRHKDSATHCNVRLQRIFVKINNVLGAAKELARRWRHCRVGTASCSSSWRT